MVDWLNAPWERRKTVPNGPTHPGTLNGKIVFSLRKGAVLLNAESSPDMSNMEKDPTEAERKRPPMRGLRKFPTECGIPEPQARASDLDLRPHCIWQFEETLKR